MRLGVLFFFLYLGVVVFLLRTIQDTLIRQEVRFPCALYFLFFFWPNTPIAAK